MVQKGKKKNNSVNLDSIIEYYELYDDEDEAYVVARPESAHHISTNPSKGRDNNKRGLTGGKQKIRKARKEKENERWIELLLMDNDKKE